MSVQPIHTDKVNSTRRALLFGALAGTALLAMAPMRTWATSNASVAGIKALTFDMQGTVFDFYDPVVQRAQAIGRKYGLADDWAATLPGDWSGGAHDIIVDISAGRRPWISNTEVYREALLPLLVKRGVGDRLSDTDRDQLLGEWGKMAPWPDSVAGLTQLRRKYTLSTLTNASMAQMTALVKDSKLPFDEVLTGELSHAFKPDPRVYQSAVDYTGFRPDQLLMVSAHKWDLHASKQAGFHTAYVPRPLELGPGHAADRKPESFIDIIADDLVDLANKLGI
ncbi:haloacid dehalogenase type II [Paraburkholderia sp. PGU16]|uniref:(S)-2-haloacid dehalogenase n=1 Tax=Paraburkholderia largidicola TaxID=3014751 RepID=A0A7I8BW54_9BURK|nr:haloacid dehalogenase type II [Paraburkholderia sp. PGU16]BCF92745.1 haloacid dehalogenase [Paraburkholderia sp. PGU16]BEU25918.1 haloacid dehalogenase type II [Paraburkholderia sp. 22B1P]GJH33254.1 haloacid dehalogenase type II [Paraburkholderia hospita]